MRMAAPSQVKRLKPFRASIWPADKPSRIVHICMEVVINKRTPAGIFWVPVHKPADILSTDRARPSKTDSFRDRIEGTVLLMDWEILSVVRR